MTNTGRTIEDLAEGLGIEAPDLWRDNWDAFLQWRTAGGCGIGPGDLPASAIDVLDLPTECLADLDRVRAAIQADTTLSDLADLYHFLMFHLPGRTGLSEAGLPSPSRTLGDRAPLFPLSVLACGADHALAAYREAGLPEDTALATLSVGGFYARDHFERYGTYGLSYLGWMRNHVQASIFRLGRLLFNAATYDWPFRVYRHRGTGDLCTLCGSAQSYRRDGLANGTNSIFDPDAWTAELELTPNYIQGHPVTPTGKAIREPIRLDLSEWEPLITPGDQMICVHIPAVDHAGKLLHGECVRAYHLALEFFSRYYPDSRFTSLTCWSWLLDPNLAMILPRSSNIVEFQSDYHLLPVIGNELQCYDLVFNTSSLDLPAISPKTNLQRAIVDHVAGGNRMRSAAGYITISEARDMA